MNKKTKIIIAIALILLVLAVIFIVINYNSTEQNQNNQVNESSDNQNNTEPETEPAPVNTQKPVNEAEPVIYSFNENEEAQREMTQEDLKQMAFAISERFGSYSNEGNFGNISDLKIYMTESMKTWAENYIAEQSQDSYSGTYYGITSTALVGEILSFNEEEASIKVTTKRREVENNTENVFNQDIIINFKKVGDEYKVNGAYWQ